jgi:hypothetical protein
MYSGAQHSGRCSSDHSSSQCSGLPCTACAKELAAARTSVWCVGTHHRAPKGPAWIVAPSSTPSSTSFPPTSSSRSPHLLYCPCYLAIDIPNYTIRPSRCLLMCYFVNADLLSSNFSIMVWFIFCIFIISTMAIMSFIWNAWSICFPILS